MIPQSVQDNFYSHIVRYFLRKKILDSDKLNSLHTDVQGAHTERGKVPKAVCWERV